MAGTLPENAEIEATSDVCLGTVQARLVLRGVTADGRATTCLSTATEN
jgi:hypothetical protein